MSCGQSLLCVFYIWHRTHSDIHVYGTVDMKMTQSDRYLEDLDERLLKYALWACLIERRPLGCASSMVQSLQVRNQDLLSPHQQRKPLHLANFLTMHATYNCHSRLFLQHLVIKHAYSKMQLEHSSLHCTWSMPSSSTNVWKSAKNQG